MTSSFFFATHELFVVVHEHLLLVDLHELVSEAAQDVSRAGGVAQSKYVVWLVQWRLGAVADFEAFLVPVHHGQLLCELLNIAVDIRYLDAWATDNDACGQIETVRRF